MQDVIKIYKNMGETPLEALERVRQERAIPETVPMTYAGRLDPLVEGELLVLVGEECKQKEQYTNLPKTYEFEILAGVSTDTYDLLGLVTETDFKKTLTPEQVQAFLEAYIGTQIQSYPPYSSKTVDGKQLHQHAREGNTPHVQHEVALTAYEYLGERTMPIADMLQTTLERIQLVHGDFRQDVISAAWKACLENNTQHEVCITRWRVHVSSGFYIRQLVHDIGTHYSVPTVTFHIKRTKIG